MKLNFSAVPIASSSRRTGPSRRHRLRLAERMQRDIDVAFKSHAGDRESLSTTFAKKYMADAAVEADALSASFRSSAYRNISPLEATALFAEHYRKLAADKAYPWGRQPYAGATPVDMRHFWRARQCADALGMQYDHYLSAVFNGFASKGRFRRPTPKQLSEAFAVLLAKRRHKDTGVDVEFEEYLAAL
jgi:hypothetical protein